MLINRYNNIIHQQLCRQNIKRIQRTISGLKRKISNLKYSNKKIKKENKEINTKAASYKKGMEMMTERFEEEKRQKEAAWSIEDKVKRRVVNIVIGTKTLMKENNSLTKINTKLEEENKTVTREYENRIIKQRKVHKKGEGMDETRKEVNGRDSLCYYN